MKKHFIIFIIVFALTVTVPIIVCTAVGSHVSNESVAGIFDNVKGDIVLQQQSRIGRTQLSR